MVIIVVFEEGVVLILAVFLSGIKTWLLKVGSSALFWNIEDYDKHFAPRCILQND